MKTINLTSMKLAQCAPVDLRTYYINHFLEDVLLFKKTLEIMNYAHICLFYIMTRFWYQKQATIETTHYVPRLKPFIMYMFF